MLLAVKWSHHAGERQEQPACSDIESAFAKWEVGSSSLLTSPDRTRTVGRLSTVPLGCRMIRH